LLATRGQITRERRIVTILYSDVKDATAMAEHLDPEEVMEIMEGALDVLIGPIARYEGTVARLMGDAVLAFFGAPIAHEDDAERACRAALDIVEGAEAYATRLEEKRGLVGFSVRVAIHTGLVVVGEVGPDLRMEYTAMGDAVNVASGMQGAAEPGMLLVTEDTHKLIAPLFEAEALGSIEVEGRRDPVGVYRVLTPRDVVGKGRGIAGLASPLVGRDAELQTLQEALQRLQMGVGGIVTVVGEAGIGKSRLVAEVQRSAISSSLSLGQGQSGEATQHGLRTIRWVEGRCLSYGQSMAYLPWVDMLHRLLGMSVEDAPLAVRDALRRFVETLCPDHFDEVYTYLGRMMSLPLKEGVEERLGGLEPEGLKVLTFRAVERVLATAVSAGPVVLVCEDLHWADATSLELLEQVLALTDRCSLLFICAFRPYRDHGCWGIREIASRLYDHRYTDTRLRPLSVGDSEELVANLLHVQALPHPLRMRILEHAEGNPFYVEEVIRSLIDSDVVVHDQATDQWQATRRMEDIAIPDTLQGVLMARIDRLEEEARRVLQIASVIGRIFLYRILAAIAEEEQALDEQLLTLQREEMIRERVRMPELEYIFKHHLTQQAAYNGLLRRERRRFHRQVAEVLEGRSADRMEEQVDLLTHHWEQAEEPEKAVHYLRQAGDRAVGLSANREAIAHYTRALDLLETLPETRERDQREVALQLALVVPITAVKSWGAPEAGQACARARQLCEKLGDAPQLFPAMIWMRYFYTLRAQHHTTRELAERIYNLAESVGDPLQIMMAHIDLAISSFYLGQLQAATAHAERVIASYDPRQHHSLAFVYGQDPGVVARGVAVYTLWLLGYPEQALQRGQEMLALARQLDHPFSLAALALPYTARVHRFRREVQAVQELTEEVLQLGTERGIAMSQAEGITSSAWVLSEQGHPQEAIAPFRQGLDAWQSAGKSSQRAEFMAILAEMCGKAGRIEEGLCAIAEARSHINETGERYWEAEVYRIEGELLRMKGVDETEVERHFLRAIEVARRQSAESLELRATMSLCRLWQTQGRVDDARALLAEIYGWFTEGFDTGDLTEARALLEELSSGSDLTEG